MKLRIATSGDKNEKVLLLAKRHFEEKHPNVSIDIEPLPIEILEQQIAQGNPPDLIEWVGSDIGQMLDRNVVVDLAPLAKDASFDLSDFYPAVMNAASSNGRIGVLPVMAEVPGVFYNKSLLDQAGVAYPTDDWTWDEFVKKARKLNIYDADGEVIRHGAYLVPRLLPVEPLVWSLGGAFLSEDGMIATGYLDSQETVDAFRKYLEAFNPLELTPYHDLGSETWVACFIHQKMAMYYDASWTIKPMRDEHYELFGAVKPPRMGDRPLRNLVQVYGYGISPQTADLPLAWAFLQELASPHTESGKEWAVHNLAVSRTVALRSGQQDQALFKPFLESLEDAKLGAFDVSSMKLWNVLNNDVFQDWVIRGGRINLEDRLKRIAQEYDELT